MAPPAADFTATGVHYLIEVPDAGAPDGIGVTTATITVNLSVSNTTPDIVLAITRVATDAVAAYLQEQYPTRSVVATGEFVGTVPDRR